MYSPKKTIFQQRDSSFIIRKTVRPPTALRASEGRGSPDKRYRDGRRSINDYYITNRTMGPSSLGLSTSCWCLFDSRTNKELGFRQNYQRQIASLTKIMTVIVTIEAVEKWGIKMSLLVRVTDVAAKMTGTSANLKAGHWITLRDLLYGTMLPSGNDAAYTLAEVIGYLFLAEQKIQRADIFSSIQRIDLCDQITVNYVSEFIRVMNIKAEQLGLIHTRFSNPHGLQNALNVSSARDIIFLSVYASKNELFRQVMNSEVKRYQLFSDEYKSEKEIGRWYNTNKLLSKGWEGVKTGQTLTAGCCLSSLKNGVYIVVLNSSDPERRFMDTQKLYSWYVQSQGWCESRACGDSPSR